MPEMDQVVLRTHRLEALLKQQYHAQGNELEQLIVSCQERLPSHITVKLHFIVGMSQKIESGHQTLEESREFFLACKECEKELTPRSGRFVWRIALSLMTVMTLAAVLFYYMHWDELNQHFGL